MTHCHRAHFRFTDATSRRAQLLKSALPLPAPRRPNPQTVEARVIHFVSPGEIEQLFLGIWKPAFGSDAAEPMRQLAVMRPGIYRPPVPVGGDVPAM
jgi:hypothetical protein